MPDRPSRLLRLGENAIYEIQSSSLVVRIARDRDRLPDVQKEGRVARWLAEHDFPATRLADVGIEQPFIVDGHPVTVWVHVDHGDDPVRPEHLGKLLRRFHALPMPTWLDLPDLRVFARVEHRLGNAPPEVPSHDVDFLYERLTVLKQEYTDLDWIFPPGPVHGDAHRGNLLYSRDGQVLLLDFESTACGQPEWDLSLSAGYRYTLAWYTAAEYQQFTDAYGYDIATWNGFHTLRQIRELGMVSWLSQMVGHRQDAASEFSRRMEDLRSGTLPRRWSPL